MTKEVLGFNVWTKNNPQKYLELYPEYAKDFPGAPLVAIVDDVLPAVVFKRSNEEIEDKNEAYRNYMLQNGFDSVVFVSDMLPDRLDDLKNVVDVAQLIGVSTFMRLIPEVKRAKLEELTLTETLDTCWQIGVLETGISTQGITRYLTGKRSTYLFNLAKEVVPGLKFSVVDKE